MRFPNKKAVAEKILLLVFGLIIAFVMLEVLLRVSAATQITGEKPPVIAEFNPALGWSYIPNSNSWILEPAYFKEGTSFKSNLLIDVNINSFGFRDREWEHSNQSTKKRIAFIGDSYVFGDGVKAKKRFSNLSASEKCETLNFGVAGYSTDQELLLARETVFPFSPDVIVLGLFLGNDVEDNAVPLPANTTKSKPYFVLEDTNLELKNFPVLKTNEEQRQTYFLLEVKRWLNQNIYSYTFLVSLLRSIPFTNNILVATEKNRDFTPGLDLTIAIIEQFKEEAGQHNAELLVLIIPSPHQLSKSDDKRNSWVPYLSQKFREKGIEFIDLLQNFKNSPEQHFYFVSNEHLDENGNKRVAEILRQHSLLQC